VGGVKKNLFFFGAVNEPHGGSSAVNAHSKPQWQLPSCSYCQLQSLVTRNQQPATSNQLPVAIFQLPVFMAANIDSFGPLRVCLKGQPHSLTAAFPIGLNVSFFLH